MSIYRSHPHRSLDNDLAWERVLNKAGKPRPVPTPVARPAQGWGPLRKANPFNGLLPSSRNWLGKLPFPLQPNALAAKFPRIVNLLAQQWNDTATCRRYLDELVAGGRPNRRGFSADVRRDLLGLREYLIRCRRSSGDN